MNGETCREKARGEGKAPAAQTPREIDLREILGEATEIMIRHGVERYRLRLTRQNKLILTK